MTQPVLVDEPVDLSRAEYVEITITRDRVYVHADRGLMAEPWPRRDRRK
jgi:hypothetical protein